MSLLRFLLMSLILLSTTLWAGVGKVALLKGEATLERGVQKLALQNGTLLEEKDTIKTSKDAQVQLMFEDKTVITLGSESEFKIEEYLNDTANPKAKFKFNQGAFKTITGQIGKTAPDNFKLETKTATIGIRGTIVAGNVPPPPPPSMPPMPEAIFCLSGTITVASIAVPNVVIIVPKGSFTQIPTPNAPPAPPVIFTPADLQQINQNLGGTPPLPPASTTPSQTNNTPAAATTDNSEGNNDKAPPPAAPLSAAPSTRTVTPAAVGNALQTNTQTNTQASTISNIITTIVEQTGASAEEVKNQILNQTCPSGTSGTYPNCVVQTCPSGTTGVYPNCVTLTCPTGTIGTYPNCIAQTCPTGTTGTYPNCVALTCPDGTTGVYPNCTLISPPSTPELPMTCPSGTIGTFPDCVVQTCPSGTTGVYPNCTQLPPALPEVPSVCPNGTSGTYPNCVTLTCPTGTTGTYPNCNALTCADLGQQGTYPNCGTCTASQTGTYPNCVDLTCPAGTTGTYPNCNALTCADLGQQGTYPNCGTCTASQTGTYPNCVDLTCPAGTTGTYPNCNQTVNLELTGLATASLITSGTLEHPYDNDFTMVVIDSDTYGNIGGVLDMNFSTSSISAASPTIFTLTIPDSNITQISSISSPDSNVLWGQWTSASENNATLLPTTNNFWVAGKVTDRAIAATHIASIYSSTNEYTTYTYLGKTLGVVYDASHTAFLIDPSDVTNEVKLVFKFGNNTAPIASPDSYIRFTANGFWDIGIAHASATDDGFFDGMLSNGFGGTMIGAFYGTNAASLGGTFNATNSTNNSSATGAFVASKTHSETSAIPLVVSGYGTSMSFSNDTTHYHTEDALQFYISNHTSASGISMLNPDRPQIVINASSTSVVSDFGPSTDGYLYWGKWTSPEIDNNASLLASPDNFWVAGVDASDAVTYITNLIYDSRTPILTYEGNVIGSTYANGARYAIDEDAYNKVKLQFNLGESDPIDANSEITFISNNELWSLKPFGSNVLDGTFTTSFNSDSAHIWDENGNRRNVNSGTLNGIFYGTNADAAGGTFQASDYDGVTALGVFKTIKTSEFYYPTNFDPALNMETTDVGVVAYTGLATSRYNFKNLYIIDRIDTTFDLSINTSDHVTLGTVGDFSLERDGTSGGDDTYTYTSANNFAIKDFTANKGWIQTDDSEPNDYVSWGYWAVHSTDETILMNGGTFWVAGNEAAATSAISHINNISTPTHYIYTGKVLGTVEEGGTLYNIASNTSSVQLKFEFGGDPSKMYNDSSGTQYNWVRFEANGKQWDLRPALTGSLNTYNGTFSDALSGNVITAGSSTPITSGAIQGKFYGDQAQAVGGTFNAATASAKALGVFKAVKP